MAKLSPTMIAALNDAAEGKPIKSQRTLEALKTRGLLDEQGQINEAGITEYEANGGECMDVAFLVLGTPVTLKTKKGNVTLAIGSRLQVVFRERFGKTLYYSCFAGQGLPLVYVGYNRAHKFDTLHVPKNLPLRAEYK